MASWATPITIVPAFEREAVRFLTGDWPDTLIVAGFLTEGNIFLGTSTVKIIHPGMKSEKKESTLE